MANPKARSAAVTAKAKRRGPGPSSKVGTAQPPAPSDWLHRLHDPASIVHRAAAAAHRLGLRRRPLAKTEAGPVDLFETVTRHAKGGVRPRVYLSAGIHGDEAGAVEAVLRWMEGAGAAKWATLVDLTIVPCLNPAAIASNSRLGPDGLDWNRGFARLSRHAVIDALKLGVRARGPFDLALLLHEDYDACGLYLYELRPDREPLWGADLIAAAAKVLPADPRHSIDGSRAHGGVITRSLHNPAMRTRVARFGMPEAVWLSVTGLVARVCTIEAPSEYDAERRAEGLKAVIEKGLGLLMEEKEEEVRGGRGNG